MPNRTHRGFTLIELIVVVAIVAILAAIAIPGLLAARMSGNEASAISSLRTINSSQMVFATTCGHGFYAATLGDLAAPQIDGQPGFINPDLGGPLESVKSGYTVEVRGTAAEDPPNASCNDGAMATGYVAVASPFLAGVSGSRYFWTNGSSSIYRQTSPFTSENEIGAPADDAEAETIR